MTTADLDSEIIGMGPATQMVACLFCAFIAASHDHIVVTLTSVPLPTIETGAECSGSILHDMEIYPESICWYMWFVCSKKFSANFWLIPSQLNTCRSLICLSLHVECFSPNLFPFLVLVIQHAYCDIYIKVSDNHHLFIFNLTVPCNLPDTLLDAETFL